MSDVTILDQQFDPARFRELSPKLRAPITHKLEALFEDLIDEIAPALLAEIGAFEGDFSRRMEVRHPSAEIYTFEANPRVFEQFSGGFEGSRIRYLHLAIGDKAGEAEIHIPEQIANAPMPYANRMASLNVVALRDSKTTAVRVPMLPLDSALADTPPEARAVLWVDVEGAISQVLDGAEKTLQRTDLLLCELEDAAVWHGQTLAPVIRERMNDLGFTLLARDCQKWFQYNAIFVRTSKLTETMVKKVDIFTKEALKIWCEITPPRLFQYWDKTEPPAEVKAIMKTWADDPSFSYYKFDKVSASEMIGRNFDERTLRAFQACKIPAMQADLFRLCAIYAFGGIYVDADIENKKTNDFILRSEGRGFLYMRRQNLANDIMVVNNPRDELIAHALEKAISNIESRLEANVWEVTGPGILTASLNSLTAEHPLFKGFHIGRVEEVRTLVGFQWELDYKKAESHWVNSKNTQQDLYQSAP